jgi:transposase InsO family protein
MDQRREFVRLSLQEGVNRRELCRRFGIAPSVGYKWLARHAAGDVELADRSRRPRESPGRCAAGIEALVIGVRDAHPAWGARKIASFLTREGHASPAFSTVHQILRRNGRVDPPAGKPGEPYRRFEMEAPNLIWQMDFKGHAPLGDGRSCHPLTVIDDHSRYALCLAACADEQGQTVKTHLEAAFRVYGLPEGDCQESCVRGHSDADGGRIWQSRKRLWITFWTAAIQRRFSTRMAFLTS